MDTYKDIIGEKANDFIFREGTIPMIFMTVYLAGVKQTLKNYGKAINIDKDLIPLLDLECEIAMEQEQLSISKKNYVFTIVVKDFMYKPGKMESRGFRYKKSDANSTLAEHVENDIKTRIMCHLNELNFKDLINKIHTTTKETIEDIKTDNFIINKKSVVKVSDINDISWGDTRMKAVRLWDKLFPDTPIELPGSLGILKINITEDIIESYKLHNPSVYNVLVEQAKELFKYSMQNKVLSKVKLIMSPDEEEEEDSADIVRSVKEHKSDKIRLVMKDIVAAVNGRFKDRDANYGLYDDLYKLIYENGLSESEVKFIEKLFKIVDIKNADLDTYATKKIDRLAVPIDINTVPLLLKQNNYEILDIEASSEYEHLLSPILNTTSISVPKNKSGKAVVTSVLQVF